MAILIVDDDPVQCRLLEAMLQKSGYETVVLDNGDAALTLLGGADGARIDCVILDLVMPNFDGLGVLARLRQASINVPVIVQTAHGGIDNVVSAMRAGAIDFVVKPVGRRAPAGEYPQRAQHQRARGRTRAHQTQPLRHARL